MVPSRQCFKMSGKVLLSFTALEASMMIGSLKCWIDGQTFWIQRKITDTESVSVCRQTALKPIQQSYSRDRVINAYEQLFVSLVKRK